MHEPCLPPSNLLATLWLVQVAVLVDEDLSGAELSDMEFEEFTREVAVRIIQTYWGQFQERRARTRRKAQQLVARRFGSLSNQQPAPPSQPKPQVISPPPPHRSQESLSAAAGRASRERTADPHARLPALERSPSPTMSPHRTSSDRSHVSSSVSRPFVFRHSADVSATGQPPRPSASDSGTNDSASRRQFAALRTDTLSSSPSQPAEQHGSHHPSPHASYLGAEEEDAVQTGDVAEIVPPPASALALLEQLSLGQGGRPAVEGEELQVRGGVGSCN